MVDHFVTNFTESNCYIFDNFVNSNTNLSIDEAVYYKPGALCPRTPIDWGENVIMDFHDEIMFERTCTRWLLYFVDWASHFLVMEDLDVADKITLIKSRLCPVTYQHLSLKIFKENDRNLLFCCGVYLPTKGEEVNLVNLSEP